MSVDLDHLSAEQALAIYRLATEIRALAWTVYLNRTGPPPEPIESTNNLADQAPPPWISGGDDDPF